MDVCSRGLVKPYDPVTYFNKLKELAGDNADVQSLMQCCPPSTEVRDVKDLKKYILAAAERISDILDLRPLESYDSRSNRR